MSRIQIIIYKPVQRDLFLQLMKNKNNAMKINIQRKNKCLNFYLFKKLKSKIQLMMKKNLIDHKKIKIKNIQKEIL